MPLTHREIAETLRGLLDYLGRLDDGALRAHATPGDGGLDGVLRSFEDRFDPPVGQIADPSVQAQASCGLLGFGTKEDTLYDAAYPDMLSVISVQGAPPGDLAVILAKYVPASALGLKRSAPLAVSRSRRSTGR